MSTETIHIIYTIGHSTRSISEFIDLLKQHDIQVLADIRSFPGSRKYLQFNKENLQQSLEQNAVSYIHFPGLGGRRKPLPNSKNTRWHNDSFRAYADYMETPLFEQSINQLQEIAIQKRVAYMCSEAVWWRCHRSMVSDYLKAKSWKVLHILSETKTKEHFYTSPARVVGDKVLYYDEDLFS